jgi:hypothetical protein
MSKKYEVIVSQNQLCSKTFTYQNHFELSSATLKPKHTFFCFDIENF